MTIHKSCLFDVIRRFSIEQPGAPALSDKHRSISWQQLNDSIDALATTMSQYQYRVIALHAENSIDWALIDLACMKANVILLPIPLFFSQQQIQHTINESGAVALICENKLTLEQKEVNSRVISNTLSLYEFQPHNDDALIPELTTKITFTSGSTGTPKGVCLSRDNQLNVARSLVERVGLVAPKHLCVLPLSTLLENIAGVYAPLYSGGHVMLRPSYEIGFSGGNGFSIQQFTQTITETSPSSMIVLPELLQALIAAVSSGWVLPKTVSFIAVGGSKVSPKLLSQAQALGIPVYEGYGLSECSSVVSLNSINNNALGTTGKPLPHVEVTLIDNQVVVTGNAFLGYLNQPETWGEKTVNTGDLGIIDDNGNLVINGRSKNLLISSYGRNINPEWVESELLANPLIKHCVVFGDAKPFCIALIEKRNPDVLDSDIQTWISMKNEKLPEYARIFYWQNFSEPLSVSAGTLTATGKPVRQLINIKYNSQLSDLYKEYA
jgi:long-subunit acyl-CoA synthetase (AMP-forming)